jgi:hypothetical protein
MNLRRGKFKEEIIAERFLHDAWKEIKRDSKYMMKWYLFYQPKSNSDRIWHFIQVVIVDVILLRIFGLI